MRVEIEINMYNLYASGDNSDRPESMAITYDSEIVERMQHVLNDNSFLDSVDSSYTLDYEIEGYAGNVADPRIEVNEFGGVWFRFAGEWDGVEFEYDINRHIFEEGATFLNESATSSANMTLT